MRAQLDATARGTESTAPRAAADGELRIVSGDTGAVAGGTGANGEAGAIGQLESQLVASEEERERVSRENTELLSRLDQTIATLEQSQRQIDVRDQQIAQLQERLREIAANDDAAADLAPPPVAPVEFQEQSQPEVPDPDLDLAEATDVAAPTMFGSPRNRMRVLTGLYPSLVTATWMCLAPQYWPGSTVTSAKAPSSALTSRAR